VNGNRGQSAQTPPDQSAASQLNDVVHQRTRLGLLAVLAEVGEADFSYLKNVLHLTDGNLGQHLQLLERHGLVSIRKGHEGGKARTWAEITRGGRAALDAEIKTLKALLRI
jgi:DNA-binding MarR family transcriptional regulator